MKNLKRTLLALMLALAMLICFAGCTEDESKENATAQSTSNGEIVAQGLWATAKYFKDTTVGEGSKTVMLDIELDSKSITITLKTDEKTLGQALYKENLINDASFFDTLNGVKADWNADKAYWAFYIGEDYAPVGVNETQISGGEHYRFVYTK